MDGNTQQRHNSAAAFFGLLRTAFDPCIVGWVGLLIALLFWLHNIPRKDLDAFWMTSDSLYPVNLITDLFVDRYPLNGWQFSTAGFWFPEVFLAGIGFFFTRNVVLATLIGGALQFVVLVAAFELCWRILPLKNRGLVSSATLGTAIIIALYAGAHTGRLYSRHCALFMLSLHVGNLVMTMLALDCGLLFMTRQRLRSLSGAACAIICSLATMSNTLFLAHFVAPFSGALFLMGIARALPWNDVLRGLKLVWVAALAGAAAAKLFFRVTNASGLAEIGLKPLKTALQVFWRGTIDATQAGDLSHLLAYGWLLISILLGSLLLLRAVRNRSSRIETPLFLLFSAASAICSAAAVILVGMKSLTEQRNYVWTMHYLHPMFVLPFFAWPLLLAFLPALRRPPVELFLQRATSVIMVAVPSYFLLFQSTPRDFALRTYQPAMVRFLDARAAEEHLRYGYAGYWTARLITLFSTKSLRAYQVNWGLQPFLWENNELWYSESLEDRGKAPSMSFVVLNDPAWNIAPSAAYAALGMPEKELRFNQIPILIYTGGSRGAVTLNRPLSSFVEQIESAVDRLNVRPGPFTLAVTIKNTGKEVWSSLGSAPVTASYKWFERGKILPLEGARTSLPAPLRPGETATIALNVVAPPAGTDLMLKITLVQEGVAWFMSRGAPTLDIPVKLVQRTRKTH